MLTNFKVAFILFGAQNAGSVSASQHLALKDRLFQIQPDGTADAESVIRAASLANDANAEVTDSGTVGVALDSVRLQPTSDSTASQSLLPQVKTEIKDGDAEADGQLAAALQQSDEQTTTAKAEAKPVTTSTQPTLPQNAGSEAKAAEESFKTAVKLENEEAQKAEAESAGMVTELLKTAADTVKQARDRMHSATEEAIRNMATTKKIEDEKIDAVLNSAKMDLKAIDDQAQEAVRQIKSALTQHQMVLAMRESDNTANAAEHTAAKFLEAVNNMQNDMSGVTERTNKLVNNTSDAVASQRAAVKTQLAALAKESLDAGQNIGAKLSAKELSRVIEVRTSEAAGNINAQARAFDAEANTILTNFMTSSKDMMAQITNDAAAAKQQMEARAKGLSDAAKQSADQRWIANAQWMQAEADAVAKVNKFNDDNGVNEGSASGSENAASGGPTAGPESATSVSVQSHFTPFVVGALAFFVLAFFAGIYFLSAHKSRMAERQALY